MSLDTPLPTPKFDKPVKVLIAVSNEVPDVTSTLSKGAIDALEALGIGWDRIDVPRLSELGPAIGIAERMSNFDGYIVLGAAEVRGTVASDVALREAHHALTLLGLQGLCVGHSVIAVDAKVDGAQEYENKGRQAVDAALHLIALSRKWGAQRKGIGFKPSLEDYQIASGGTTA